MTINKIIQKLKSNLDLTKEDISILFHEFEQKKVSEGDIKNLVLSWSKKGEKAHELYDLANLINQKQVQNENFPGAIDVCGTGGDKTHTFNISTACAIVTSSYGLQVIKHSGRSTTSISGSVDLLGSFGFDIDLPSHGKEKCFQQTGLMFVSSKVLRELFSPVKEVCKKINQPAFVNLLGPLTNPYKTNFHLLGVLNPIWGKLLAETIVLKNQKKVLIACCKIKENTYMDELSFCGDNYIWEITDGKIKQDILTPEMLGEKYTALGELVINDINKSKAVLEDILKGKPSHEQKIKVVALNTGAALYLTKKAESIAIGYKLALQHIQSGKPWEHFLNFINSNKKKAE